MVSEPDNMANDSQTTVWRGQCGVCMNWFEHPARTEDNPSPSGTFCPVCRDERRMTAPGVVRWKAEAVNV
jgi:hypothetical protein